MQNALRTDLRQKLSAVLGSRQQLGLEMLARSLPDLRAAVLEEIATNPVLEDTDNPLERNMTAVERDRKEEPLAADDTWPTEDYTPLERRDDEEAIERRQALFDNQVAVETLQEHLTAQLPLSDLAPETHPLAEAVIGELDENGYFRGSAADLCMVHGCTEAQLDAVRAEILSFDPPGCGARDLRECLTAQLDAVPTDELRVAVARLLERLPDVAAGKFDDAAHAEALRALRRLDPHPGRAYVSERSRVEYVNPEVHAVRDESGRWCALTDRRSLPAIRISPRFKGILSDPKQDEATKAYLRERIARAREIQQAVRDRQETIENIAQAIFDRQPDFFTQGLRALKPLTEVEVAKAVGVAAATVSRTVRDKYASTPQGTIELRRFFTTGVKTEGGEAVSQEAVLARLAELIRAEDASAPLSDDALAARLREEGFPVARRTVAKYRDRLGLLSVRRRKAAPYP